MPKPTKKLTIKLNNDYKSFKAGFETTLEGDLIVLTGVNGSGKSQLLDLVILEKGIIQDNNRARILKSNIIYKTFKNLVNTQLIPEDLNYISHQAHEINGYFNYQNDLQHERCAKRFSELAIKSGFKQLVSTLNKEQIETVLNDNPNFIWQNDDIFNYDNLSSIFLHYLHKENNFIRKNNKQTVAKSIKIYRNKNEPHWLILNNIFAELGFEYRFKSDYKLKLPNIQGGVMLLDKNEKSIEFSVDSLSDGEKAIFSLVISSFKSTMEGALPKILLLDEYEATLNPSLTKAFYQVLQDFYLDKGTQVILTTHSPITIGLAPNSAKIYEIFKNGTEPRIIEIDKNEYSETSIAYENIEKEKLELSELRERVKSFENNKELFPLITEGFNVNFLKLANKLLEYNLPLYFIDGGGKDNIKGLFKTNKDKKAQTTFYIFDYDVKTELANSNFVSTSHHHCLVLPENNINSFAKKGIENMFSKEILPENRKLVYDSGVDDYSANYEKLNKNNFENYIKTRNNIDDFKNFRPIFEMIEEIINPKTSTEEKLDDKQSE